MEPFVCRHLGATFKIGAHAEWITVSLAGPNASPVVVERLVDEEAVRLRDWLLARYPINPS